MVRYLAWAACLRGRAKHRAALASEWSASRRERVLANQGIAVSITSIMQDEPLDAGPVRPKTTFIEEIPEFIWKTLLSIFGITVVDIDEGNISGEGQGNSTDYSVDAEIVDGNTVRLRKVRLEMGMAASTTSSLRPPWTRVLKLASSSCEGETTVCFPISQGIGRAPSMSMNHECSALGDYRLSIPFDGALDSKRTFRL